MEIKVIADTRSRFPLGMTVIPGGFHIRAACRLAGCSLILYKRNVSEPVLKLAFPDESRLGDIYAMTVLTDEDLTDMEYAFEAEGALFADSYAFSYSGRDAWGKSEQVFNPRRSPIVRKDYDWEGDRPLCRPYNENIIYRMHVRGFTNSPSSGVTHRGTFEGIIEKLPYLKALGINAIELMPCQEFEEIMLPTAEQGHPYGKLLPTGRLNYWGYGADTLHFAPKSSFCRKKNRNPSEEMKDLVKAAHREGIELIAEFYFNADCPEYYIIDVLRYWAAEYHLDGIKISGYAPRAAIASDPYLAGLKLISDYWDETSNNKMLAVENDSFLNDMRRFLKGDEGMLRQAAFHIRNNKPGRYALNYMADIRGFSLADTVSYDYKHNEANGESNKDGAEYNYSWNCGFEGQTRKKSVLMLRQRQIRNAWLLLLLSQGCPVITSSDEAMQSRKGNNNAYCQDNELNWFDWKLIRKNEEMLEWLKSAIDFRKRHTVLHRAKEPALLDTKACGLPDMSYHGVRAWQPEFESWRRQLGVMYCGAYAEGEPESNIYIIYNMHWEPHDFALPKTERGCSWHLVTDTSLEDRRFYKDEEALLLEVQESYSLSERAIAVFITKGSSEPAFKKRGGRAGGKTK